MTSPLLIMESPKHADHPLVRDGSMVWMPLYRCHANPDSNVPNGYGLPAADVRGFCKLAAKGSVSITRYNALASSN